MTNILGRRDFLKGSVALAGTAAAGGFTCVEIASAAPIEVPAVDKLAIRVLIDSHYDAFLPPRSANGVSIQHVRGARDYRRTIHNEFGLSLLLESQRGNDQRAVMLDFGYTAQALLNNIEIVGLDPRKIEALVVSHGHYDHFGGLDGFLQKYRDVLPADIKLYAGGETLFCRRHRGAPGQLTDWGAIDRRELTAQKVAVVLAENPTVIAGHAFTTGKIKRTSFETVSGGALVEYAMKDGVGCNAGHFVPAELEGKITADEHIHEHATCFNVKDRGLVVISSCGHVGIVNSVRQAQEVSGVQKVHAIVGGFHLAPSPKEYVDQVVAEMKKLQPDAVIPMHCSGDNFVQAARQQMPDKLLLSNTGSLITFGV